MEDDRVSGDLTEDGALDGRLRLWQPRRGHRFGHDAVLLAASTDARLGDQVVELGAGVGLAGLALATRVRGVGLTLVDIDPALTALAVRNAAANGIERVRAVTLDVGAPARAFAAAGLPPGSAQCVMMNPPYNNATEGRPSPDRARASAHSAGPETLETWIRAATRLLVPGGVLTLIWRADGIAEALATLVRGFGGIAVLPVHPRENAAAIRILVRAVKASRAPLALLPGLILHGAEGRPTAAAEAILRGGTTTALADWPR